MLEPAAASPQNGADKPDAVAYVAAFVADGAAPDTDVLDRPTVAAGAALQAAERERQRWSAILEQMPSAIGQKRQAVERAKPRWTRPPERFCWPKRPRRCVAALDGLEDLIAEVERRTHALTALDRMGVLAPDQQAEVAHALRRRDPFMPSQQGAKGHVLTIGFDRHPAVVAWNATLQALRSDPSAELPGLSN